MQELRLTQLEKTLPCILIGERQLDPRAGRPQLEQSGPMHEMPLVCMWKAIHKVNLGYPRIWWEPVVAIYSPCLAPIAGLIQLVLR